MPLCATRLGQSSLLARIALGPILHAASTGFRGLAACRRPGLAGGVPISGSVVG